MKKVFVEEVKGIFRLKVPLDDIYTSVFLVKTGQGYAMVDCATTESDVNDWIAPALDNMGLAFSDIAYLVLTHRHGDHAGGMRYLLGRNPKMQCLADVETEFFDGVFTYALKGHTVDCIGVFDSRTGTLIAGDGLQGAGVGKFACTLESKDEYFKTIDKIRQDTKIENVLFSHAYRPWLQDKAFGRQEIEICLQQCAEHINKVENKSID